MDRKIKKYSGIIVPMITPFTEDEKIDEGAVERIVENFIASESSPLLFGTTGETASITQSQKTKYAELVTKKFGNRTKVYTAISDSCFDDALRAAKTYFDIGVEAVVVLLPGYYPITVNQMQNYYETFADKILDKFYRLPEPGAAPVICILV